jgi:RsiW-degrading membrane proteinase PrsW (M82 family)
VLFTFNEEIPVKDVIYIVLTVLFFGVAILYLRACERLK